MRVVLTWARSRPFADRALSGAGWEAVDSESVAARHALEAQFPGAGSYALSVVVAGPRAGIDDPAARSTLARVVDTPAQRRRGVGRAGPADLTRPQHARSSLGLAGGRPDEMVEAAGRLKTRLADLSSPGTTVRLTGPAAMWSDFNAENKAAMLKSELLSWPLTLVLLVFAFGTLVAAGLPLLLTMAGLLGAGGLLFVVGQFADVSIWAMNFAMMFAIALGIDYALFIVVRFRSALAAGLAPREATVVTMATAGKAVLVSGLTVIAALLALTLVPVPAFRTVPIGIGLAVLMVLAATLTLLPAALSRLGRRINGGRVRMRGAIDHRSERFAAWGARLWARPLPVRRRGRRDPAAARRPGARAADRDADRRRARAAMPARAQGQPLIERAFGEGAPSALQIVVRATGRGGRAVDARARPGHRRGRARGALERPGAAHRHPQAARTS